MPELTNLQVIGIGWMIGLTSIALLLSKLLKRDAK